MNNSDVIRKYLKETKLTICDDHLSSETKITPRSAVYQICNKLWAEKKIFRNKGFCSICENNKKKYVNSYNENAPAANEDNEPVNGDISVNPIPEQYSPPVDSEILKDKPWHWEGNVQSILVKHLIHNGISVSRTANTATREQGIDIEAISQTGCPIWITVKGYPEDKGKAHPATQARHWFSQAIFDIILYRNESEDASLAIGLPDGYPAYINLAKRINWFLKTSKTTIYWVSKSGRVRETS